jgi:hypothetical protein
MECDYPNMSSTFEKMSKFLNTSILNLSIELIIKPQALDKTSCYKCNGTKREAGRAWGLGVFHCEVF